MHSEQNTAQQQALLGLGQALERQGYRFVTGTPLTHERVNARGENQQARDLAGVFGWSRPFTAQVVGDELVELMRAGGVLMQQGPQLSSAVRWSSLGDKLFVHSRYPTVQTDAVFFGPDTVSYTHLTLPTICSV